jgi:cytochrome c oxidase cbb3-type subunit 3
MESIHTTKEFNDIQQIGRRARLLIKPTVALALALTIFSVAGYLSRCGPQLSVTQTVSAQDISGKELFANNCARCHGDDAKGGKGPDLTAAKRQAKWADSEEPLIKRITNGGLIMPKFGKKLKPEEIKAIADYVRTLKAH